MSGSNARQSLKVIGRFNCDLRGIGDDIAVFRADIMGHATDIVDLAHIPAAGVEQIHHVVHAAAGLAHQEDGLSLGEERLEDFIRFGVYRNGIVRGSAVKLRQCRIIGGFRVEDQGKIRDALKVPQVLLGVIRYNPAGRCT